MRAPGGLAELQGAREPATSSRAEGRGRVLGKQVRSEERDGGRESLERAAAMRRMCDALEDGTRKLVAWPEAADDTDVWLRPEEARATAVQNMREKYGR